MGDLTIIILTPNLVPKQWAEFHKQKLLEATAGSPIVTVSSKPLDWGTNLIQTEYGYANIYKQMLRAAKIATTPWIAMADDDTLYPKEHFAFRPSCDGYFYNLNRWHIFTWGPPFYFHKPRPGNGLLICTRELMIGALESRLKASPDLTAGHMCHELGTAGQLFNHDKAKWQKFYTREPVLSFYHDYSADRACRWHIKRAWPVTAYDIPVWGRAEDMRKEFK
ncbi:hypothetical protein ACFL29_02245 [Patescibacteria group bacterium]